MAFFLKKLFNSKSDSNGNSLQQELMLEEMQQLQESLAAQVSTKNSSEDNIEQILNKDDSKESDFQDGSDEVGNLLVSLSNIEIYEDLLESLQNCSKLLGSEKLALLKKKKDLTEYLEVLSAINSLQNIILQAVKQNPINLSNAVVNSINQQNIMLNQLTKGNNTADQLVMQKLQQQMTITSKAINNNIINLQSSNLQNIILESIKSNKTTLQEVSSRLSATQSIISNNANTLSLISSPNIQQISEKLTKPHIEKNSLNASIRTQPTNLTDIEVNAVNVVRSVDKTAAITQLNKEIANNEQHANSPTKQLDKIYLGLSVADIQKTNYKPSNILTGLHLEITPNVMQSSKSQGHGAGCGCPSCNPSNININAVNKAASQALSEIQNKQTGHGAGCGCPSCNPSNININAVSKAASQALSEIQNKQTGHGAGCGCPSCNPSNINIEPAFKNINQARSF